MLFNPNIKLLTVNQSFFDRDINSRCIKSLKNSPLKIFEKKNQFPFKLRFIVKCHWISIRNKAKIPLRIFLVTKFSTYKSVKPSQSNLKKIKAFLCAIVCKAVKLMFVLFYDQNNAREHKEERKFPVVRIKLL